MGYRAPSAEVLRDALASCERIMHSHHAFASERCMRDVDAPRTCTDGRTDGQDVDASLTLLRNSKVLNAHEQATIRSEIRGRS